MHSRRRLIQNTSIISLAMTVQPNLSLLAAHKKVLGHSEFKYALDSNWGNLGPAKVPVECREIVSDQIDKGLSFLKPSC